jgi:arylformamidase
MRILLSYYIDNNSPYYIGTTKPVIMPKNEISSGDDYNTHIIKVENHCGTHVDAPKHFIDDGRGISDYDVNELIFKHPLVIECQKGPSELITVNDISKIAFEGFDCILFKTGFGKYRKKDLNKYLTRNPGIAPETVHWLREEYHNVKCLGIDCISVSRYNDEEIAKKTHVNAFKDSENYGDPVLLIEDMNLEEVVEKQKFSSVLVIPWQIKDIDSAPCTVIANCQ